MIGVLLASDIHLREDTPVCRTDNYWQAQEQKILYISELQRKYDVPLVIGGDLFDTWRSSPHLLQWAITHLKNIIAVPGQHDLSSHSLNLFHKCNMAVLEAAGNVTVLGVGPRNSMYNAGQFDIVGCPWGVPILNFVRPPSARRRMVVAHTLTYVGDPLWPGMVASDGGALLSKLDQYDLILTGDNHKQFVVEQDGRVLVNPGSMMRMTADQCDHTPAVYGWHIDTNTVERFELPVTANVVSREHLQIQERRDVRMEAFVSKLNTNYDVGFSFKENLKQYFNVNRTHPGVKRIVWNMLEANG